MGKSRIAFEVGNQWGPSSPDGVVFVQLDVVQHAEQVAGTIAASLGARRTAGTVLDDLIGHLAGMETLLVVGNFEHVPDAAPVLSDLLAGARGLRIVVTSRSPLRIRGEQVVDVLPLSLPPESVFSDLSELARSPAVELFVQRAHAIDAAFVLDSDNADAVAAIVHRLDGFPLALELAAARIWTLPPRALLARLDSRLELLTSGARDLPGRQQTMRKTVAWSNDLLDAETQDLLALLGVFAGGFDLASAQAVATSQDLLEGITQLMDASLVRSTSTVEEPRFSLLATIREFALERLGDGDDWHGPQPSCSEIP